MNTWRDTPVCASADRIAAAVSLGPIQRQDHDIGIVVAGRCIGSARHVPRGHSLLPTEGIAR